MDTDLRAAARGLTTAFEIGDVVKVFSRDLDEWFHGQVVNPAVPGFITVHFEVDGEIHRKSLTPTSEHLQTLSSEEHAKESSSNAHGEMLHEVDPAGLPVASDKYKIPNGHSINVGYLGVAFNLAYELPRSITSKRIFKGDVSCSQELSDDMVCQIVTSERCNVRAFGAGDGGDGNSRPPPEFGKVLGVGSLGFHRSVLEQGRTRSVVFKLCRTTFYAELDPCSLVLGEHVKQHYELMGRQEWFATYGSEYIDKIYYGGRLELEIQIAAVHGVRAWQCTLDCATKLIAEALKSAATEESLSHHDFDARWAQYSEDVAIRVEAKSSCTPEGWGMIGLQLAGLGKPISFPDIVQQVKDFRSQVDKLPHDPKKSHAMAYTVKEAGEALRNLFPSAALSYQECTKFRTWMAAACDCLHHVVYNKSRLEGKLQELGKDKHSHEADLLLDGIHDCMNSLRELEAKLNDYLASGPLGVLARPPPEALGTKETWVGEIDGLMGEGKMPVSEFLGKDDLDAFDFWYSGLCYVGHILDGQPVYYGALKFQRGSVQVSWATGSIRQLRRSLEISLERHESYPLVMETHGMLKYFSGSLLAPLVSGREQ
mmetsp:Transcript_83723/g.148303  ORF Transcript_83723/g.148303 Transcript_83723/m.148303 type:complete len:597 (+) Transcript_83723:99-1889(+)